MLFIKRFISTKKVLPIEQLESLYKLSISVNNTSSTTEKYALLVKNPASHSTLKRIYDPHLRHFVTAKSVKKYIDNCSQTFEHSSYNNLNELLDALSSRSITGNTANEAIASFYQTFCKSPEHQDIFWKIIDRNLKMGVSVRTIRQLLTSNENKTGTKSKNRFISVALASSLLAKGKSFDLEKDTWFASQKLDGIRCIAMVRYNKPVFDISFYSRTGRPFTSLQKVKSDIEARLKQLGTKYTDFVLDGEICAYADKNTVNEDFIKALRQVRRINEEMENPIYQIFDMISLDQFLIAKGDQKFSSRQTSLSGFIGKQNLPHIKKVQQIKLNDSLQLDKLKIKSVESGWEGLILRKDVPYVGKRTRDMLKLKEWVDAEYIVKSIDTGLMRMPDTGEDKLVLTNVNIEHKGNAVSVGSGFSIQSRIEYAKDPSQIIGKPITVRYFSESQKEDGSLSLRFPSVKVVYEEGRRDT